MSPQAGWARPHKSKVCQEKNFSFFLDWGIFIGYTGILNKGEKNEYKIKYSNRIAARQRWQ